MAAPDRGVDFIKLADGNDVIVNEASGQVLGDPASSTSEET